MTSKASPLPTVRGLTGILRPQAQLKILTDFFWKPLVFSSSYLHFTRHYFVEKPFPESVLTCSKHIPFHYSHSALCLQISKVLLIITQLSMKRFAVC